MPWRTQVGQYGLTVLVRDALSGVATYGVIVLPGSGCAGFGPIADRYFHSLRKAKVAVLQKPLVDPSAWPAPAVCAQPFIQWDNLRDWTLAATHVANQIATLHMGQLPIVLVGISEGGEIALQVARQVPGVSALVLISSPGLDPTNLAEMVAEDAGASASWRRLLHLAAGSAAEDRVVAGRSLLYWRVLLQWRVMDALASSDLPLLQAWGGRDASIPQRAFAKFAAARSALSPESYCTLTWPAADHGLQDGAVDHIQDVWHHVELWQRSGRWSCPQLE